MKTKTIFICLLAATVLAGSSMFITGCGDKDDDEKTQSQISSILPSEVVSNESNSADEKDLDDDVSEIESNPKDVENNLDSSKLEESDNKSSDTSLEKESELSKLKNYFPLNKAEAVVVVALTNSDALDVFTTDGNDYDSSKFHDYSYAGEYRWEIKEKGTWKYKDSQTWSVENMYLESPNFNRETKLSANVKYDGKNYIITYMKYIQGPVGSVDSEDPYKTSGWMEIKPSDFNKFLTVSPSLVTNAPTEEDIKANDHKSDFTEYEAEKMFESYGKSIYPNGFKCHWILDLIAAEQDYDGTWYFKVGVTIKDSYGQKIKTKAEGKVKRDGVYDFYIYS